MEHTVSLTIEETIDQLSISNTSNFVGLTYTSTSNYEVGFPQTARFLVNTNCDYVRLYKMDLEKLETLLPSLTDPIEIEWVTKKIESIKKSLEVGIGNNPNFTRKDTVESVNGTFRKVFNKDGSFRGYEIKGVQRSKVVLIKGKVKLPKKESTRVKHEIIHKLEKSLNLTKFRCFTLSLDKIHQIRENGDKIELVTSFEVDLPQGIEIPNTEEMVTV